MVNDLPVDLPGISEQHRYLPRIGIISAGDPPEENGGRNYPVNLGYFQVSPTKDSNSPQAIENFKAVYQEQPVSIEVMLPFNRIEACIDTALRCYGKSAGLVCRSANGRSTLRYDEAAKAMVEGDPCTWRAGCPRFTGDPAKKKAPDCKLVHIIPLILPGVKGLGVWQYGTGSIITYEQIMGMLGMARGMGLPLSKIRFHLERVQVRARVNGKMTPVWTTRLTCDQYTPDEIVAVMNRMMGRALEAGAEVPEIGPDEMPALPSVGEPEPVVGPVVEAEPVEVASEPPATAPEQPAEQAPAPTPAPAVATPQVATPAPPPAAPTEAPAAAPTGEPVTESPILGWQKESIKHLTWSKLGRDESAMAALAARVKALFGESAQLQTLSFSQASELIENLGALGTTPEPAVEPEPNLFNQDGKPIGWEGPQSQPVGETQPCPD